MHDEIIFFTNYIGPRPEECLMRNEVVEKIKRVINNEWPNSQVIIIENFIFKNKMVFKNNDKKRLTYLAVLKPDFIYLPGSKIIYFILKFI